MAKLFYQWNSNPIIKTLGSNLWQNYFINEFQIS